MTQQNMQNPEHGIQRVCVIGAGVMGAGIAAQVANAGAEVLLLDLPPKDGNDRDVAAKTAIAKLQKQNPAPLMSAATAKRITPGNLEDHMKEAGECDWIIEAIVERLDIKQDLYKKIERFRKKGTVVTSNTSTLPLEKLTQGMNKTQKGHFFITHFFNPPRYMRLIEFVTNGDTDPQVMQRLRTFCDHNLGKTVVDCKDTPGFIANRIGTFWLHCAVTEAIKQNIDVETADALLSKPFGFPRTGVFALMDMVGLDLMPHILKSLREALPKADPFLALGDAPQLLHDLIEKGYTGRKGKGGFYRLTPEKTKQALNLQTGHYIDARRPAVPAAKLARKKGVRGVVTHPSAAGHYAWTVLSKTLAYAAFLLPEIADDIAEVDAAMRLGYNWKYGPFELLDKFGTDWFVEKLRAENRSIPNLLLKANGSPLYRTQKGVRQYLGLEGDYHDVVRPQGVLLLEDVKRKSKPLLKNMSASLWDVGDGVACLEFHSKMNSFNPFIMSMINKTVKFIPQNGFKALVVYNEGAHFSVGANIALLGIAAKLHFWPFVNWFLNAGQQAFMRLKHSPFPVVGAPSGMALGGGCEVLLHCNAIEAHAETYIGLVEAGVGIIPGWGGCKEMLLRGFAKERARVKPLPGWTAPGFVPGGPMKPLLEVFPLLATADVAKSAFDAQKKLFFQETDGVVMNRDRLLYTAKQRALRMVAEGFKAPELQPLRLAGAGGATALKLGVAEFVKKGIATPHDAIIGHRLAYVLTGGKADITEEVSEQDLLNLEREGLIALAKTPKTKARVFYMLKKGKPLRN